MDELVAEIREPLPPGGGEGHGKAEKAHPSEALRPVEGVGWVDKDVVIEAEVRPVAAVKVAGPPMPIAMSGVTAMADWQTVVGWQEILDRHAALLDSVLAEEGATPDPTEGEGLEAKAQAPAPSAAKAPAQPAAAAPPPPPAAPKASPWKPAEAATASAAPAAAPWKPAPAPSPSAPPTPSPWKPAEGAPAATAPATSAWKPSAPAPERPPARPVSAQAPEPPAAPPAHAGATETSVGSGDHAAAHALPPDTLKRVAVLMRKGELEKSRRVLDLWLITRPTDVVALKMIAICEEALAQPAEPPPVAQSFMKKRQIPGPDPSAVPRVNMAKLMDSSTLTPKDAFILSRIDGYTSVEQLPHLVPELSQEELTALLVKSWKAGIVSFKR